MKTVKNYRYYLKITVNGEVHMIPSLEQARNLLNYDLNYLLNRSKKKHQTHYTLKNGIQIEVMVTNNPNFNIKYDGE